MNEELRAHIVSSTDPSISLPELPEAILLLAMPGWEDWERTSSGALADMQAEAAGDAANGFATRIITIQPPPSAREVSDAEVAAIMREAGIGYPNWTDSDMLKCFDVSAKAVRAALKGAANAE